MTKPPTHPPRRSGAAAASRPTPPSSLARSALVGLWVATALAGCASTTQGGGGAEREVIEPAGQGSALFSSAVRAGDLVFLSGVIGRDGPDGVQGATRQALDGVRERVEASGGTMADVVQCTVYLTDMADYGAMNEAYAEYFPSEPPARTAVAVAEVPVSARLEIACIAAVP